MLIKEAPDLAGGLTATVYCRTALSLALVAILPNVCEQ
jgi:hypothetical protein